MTEKELKNAQKHNDRKIQKKENINGFANKNTKQILEIFT
jgi:hypothetical protein